MPTRTYRGKKSTRKPRRRGLRRAPMRRYKSPLAKSEFASMKETHSFAICPSNTAFYDYQNSLARYQRASQIGHNYREFRITKLEYQFIPLIDTFTQTDYATTTSQVPQLYWMIDKVGSFSDFNTAEDLQQAGAKPRRLDDKTIRIAFKPAVLDYVYDKNNATNAWARPITSPWLSCDKFNDTGVSTTYAPSSIDHLGLAWIVDAPPAVKYNLKVTAYFQFRKPGLHDDTPGTEDLPSAVQAPSLKSEVV